MLRTLKGWIAVILLLLIYALPVLAAVTLTDFSVAPGEQEIFVYWETASETGNLGFYVWRSEDADTGYEKLPLDSPAEQFIPSEDQGVGALYEYMDTEVTPDVVYYYKVQDVPDDGSQGEYSEVRSASIVDDSAPTDTPTATVTATPTPTAQPDDGEPEGEPQIRFWASETTLDAGDCATIQWQTENVVSVYFDGEGVTGQGARSFCPCEDQTHVLTVYLSGGGAEERSITLDTVGSCSAEDSPIATPSIAASPTPSSTPLDMAATSTPTPSPTSQALLTRVVPTVTSTPTLVRVEEEPIPATPSPTVPLTPSERPPERTETPTPFVTRAVVEGGSRRTTGGGNRALVLGVSTLFGLILIGGGMFIWKRWR
jgi:hypothetical protein